MTSWYRLCDRSTVRVRGKQKRVVCRRTAPPELSSLHRRRPFSPAGRTWSEPLGCGRAESYPRGYQGGRLHRRRRSRSCLGPSSSLSAGLWSGRGDTAPASVRGWAVSAPRSPTPLAAFPAVRVQWLSGRLPWPALRGCGQGWADGGSGHRTRPGVTATRTEVPRLRVV